MKPVKENTRLVIQNNKEAIISAVGNAECHAQIVEIFSCISLRHFCCHFGISWDDSELIVDLYRKVCRARAKTHGFRNISKDVWKNKTKQEKCNIRSAKLNKFKKYIQDNF